jgi:hypothetical protein
MPSSPYDLADRLFKLAPWNWMVETTLPALDHALDSMMDAMTGGF